MTFDVAETTTGRGSRGAHRQVCIERRGGWRRTWIRACAALTNAPSRRTPISAFAPSTTTRCSSTYRSAKVHRVSRTRRRARPTAGCSTPAAAAAACRCRWPRRRRWSSASIRRSDSRTRVYGSAANAASRTCVRARRRHVSAVPRPRTFDLVLSHAVIEHVADAPLYLRECARVLALDGQIYLSTAPYLSFAGAHLPRLKVPLPLHLMVGRRAAFATFQFLARHAPWTLKEPAHENSFIKAAQRGERKFDDLLEKVRVDAAAPADRRRRPAGRARGAARDRDGPPAAAPDRGLAARQSGDAGCADQQYRIRAGPRPAAASRRHTDMASSRRSGPAPVAASNRRGRDHRLSSGRPARRRGAVSTGVRQRCRRVEPAALGMAVRPQSEQSRARARNLDRPRRQGDRRTVRHHAGAGVGARDRSARLVGHGRDGRAGTAAAGARRAAVPHLGPPRRRRARPRPLRVVSPSVPEAALAGSRTAPLPGEAADPPRAAAAELAAAAEPAGVGGDAADRQARGAAADR